ncbi:MAG: hypothetical protein ACE5GE_14270 [Phycisphaerae bacterium]
MSELVPDTPWLRRMRWTARAGALLAVALGLIWVGRSALTADVPGVMAGAGLLLAGLVLEVLSAAISRLGSTVLRSARRVDELEAGLAALAQAMEELDDSVIGNLDLTAGGDHVDELVAARLDQPTFPRLVSDTADYGAQDETGQRELDQLVRRELERLQGEFARLVRNGHHAAALQTGERLAALFPNSNLAREFRSVRGHLARRASDDAADESATVG